MAVLGREALENRTMETKEIDVPAWGGSILIRKLSATEVPKLIAMIGASFDAETKRINDPEQMTRAIATGLYWSWVGEDGAQVLTAGAADIERLKKEPYEVLDAINDAVQEFNGMRAKAAALVADAKKNSEPTPSDDFGIN